MSGAGSARGAGRGAARREQTAVVPGASVRTHDPGRSGSSASSAGSAEAKHNGPPPGSRYQ